MHPGTERQNQTRIWNQSGASTNKRRAKTDCKTAKTRQIPRSAQNGSRSARSPQKDHATLRRVYRWCSPPRNGMATRDI